MHLSLNVMYTEFVFIFSTYFLFLAGQIFGSFAVSEEQLSLSSLQPLLVDFRRQIKTICHREQGRLDCPPEPPPSKLHIFSASYGQDFATGTTCNHVYSPFNRQVLRETCQFRSVLGEATRYCAKRNPCKMRSNQFRSSADNCQGVPKYLQLEYTCLPVKKSIQFICADSYVDVQCDNSVERMLVISAKLTSNHTYKNSICRQYSRRLPNDIQCPVDDVTRAVRQECHMKSGCSVVSPPSTVYRDQKCPKLNTILEYVCVNRKLLRRSGRPKSNNNPPRTRRPRPTEKYIPKLPRNNFPRISEDRDYTYYTTPMPKGVSDEEEEEDPKYYWLRIGLIAAGVLLFTLISAFGICQLVMRRRNRQKRAKMIRDIARQKVEDDFVKKHLGPPTSWSFPSPVSSTTGDRLNMSESWMEPTDRLIMYDWPLRKSYHGDQNLNSSLSRKKQQQQQQQPPQTTTTQEQSAIDASLPHFYHM